MLVELLASITHGRASSSLARNFWVSENANLNRKINSLYLGPQREWADAAHESAYLRSGLMARMARELSFLAAMEEALPDKRWASAKDASSLPTPQAPRELDPQQ